MITRNQFTATLLTLFILSFFGWVITRSVMYNNYKQSVEGHFVNYVSSSTCEEAEKNLDLAINALKAKGLTSGQISIFYSNPQNNLDTWFANIESAKQTLTEIRDASPLEQAVVLEKQKNALIRGSGDTVYSIRTPKGITIYSYNAIFFWWCIISLLGVIGSLIALIVLYNECIGYEPLIKFKDNKVTA